MIHQSLLVGVSRHVTDLRLMAPALAAWPGPLVIEGPSGSGKAVLADEIARHLPAGTRFERLSAATQPELLYDFLVGHVKGAFTGAVQDSPGLLELMSGGVLFLDDFQDVTRRMQRYLLDIADNKRLWAIGARRATATTIRLVIGTQVALVELTRKGMLREDLFWRLDGPGVRLLPLAERREDIPPLVRHFLALQSARLGAVAAEVSDEAMEQLLGYPWPGNARELERVLEKAALPAWMECRERPVIEARHLPGEIGRGRTAPPGRRPKVSDGLVAETMRRTGCEVKTAQMLDISTRTVRRSLRRLERAGGESGSPGG